MLCPPTAGIRHQQGIGKSWGGTFVTWDFIAQQGEMRRSSASIERFHYRWGPKDLNEAIQRGCLSGKQLLTSVVDSTPLPKPSAQIPIKKDV